MTSPSSATPSAATSALRPKHTPGPSSSSGAFDAVTVSPYLGTDSIEPFLEYSDRGVLVLCHTSGPGSVDFQDLPVGNGSLQRPLFEEVALKALEWNGRGNAGLVVGATYPQQLQSVRQICPDMVILAPGVGAQGGDLENTVKYGVNANGEGLIINSSRGIIFASRDASDFADAARRAGPGASPGHKQRERRGAAMIMEWSIGDMVTMRKPHPCGSYKWRVSRLGADIGIRCVQCGRSGAAGASRPGEAGQERRESSRGRRLMASREVLGQRSDLGVNTLGRHRVTMSCPQYGTHREEQR